MSATAELSSELRPTRDEHDARMARFAALKATALDRTLSKELRLRAVMQIDAMVWARRRVTADHVDETPDKIALAKQEAERRRLARQHDERVAKGLPVRHRRINGVWKSVEPGDSFGIPPGVCHQCGRGFDILARRSVYCSALCRRTAYRIRQRAMVNKE
jgi:hypothetical protein